MNDALKIERLKELNVSDIQHLVEASEEEGFNFLSRLNSNWESKKNCFDGDDEMLCLARIEERIIAIGGVNNNPYKEEGTVGRIRHFYVLSAYRRKGVGRAFIQHLLDESKGRYDRLTLRTDTERGTAFYEALGFERSDSENSTHEYWLGS